MCAGQLNLERIVPECCCKGEITGSETLALHLQRYEFAASRGRTGSWIDIACGVGYGTRLLKTSRPDIVSIVGVDVSEEAISYAVEHYALEGITFLCADAMEYNGGPFDTVVSLETIEHLDHPQAFLQRVAKDLLKPDGILVASVPTTPSTDVNPFHKHDFTYHSFRCLLRQLGFKPFDELLQKQPYNPLRLLFKSEARLPSATSRLPVIYLKRPRLFFRRFAATLKHGLCNKYLTVACQRVDTA